MDYIKTAKNTIAQKSGVDISEIDSSSFFEEDLNISELELLEILEELEEKLEIEDLTSHKDDIESFGDLADLLADQLE